MREGGRLHRTSQDLEERARVQIKKKEQGSVGDSDLQVP